MELTRSQKAELALASLTDCCRVQAELFGAIKECSGYDAYLTPDTFWYSRVRLHGNAPLESAIEEIAAGVKAGQLPPLICWLDNDYPDEVIMPLLEQAGYTPMVIQKAMYLALENYQHTERPIAVEPLPIERADEWAELATIAFKKPADKGGVKLLVGQDCCDFLILTEDNAITAGMMLLCRGENAGIHEVYTMDEHRGKGLGTAMVGHSLNLAKQKGCPHATLQASDMGYPVYTKLGMEWVGNIHHWVMARPQ